MYAQMHADQHFAAAQHGLSTVEQASQTTRCGKQPSRREEACITPPQTDSVRIASFCNQCNIYFQDALTCHQAQRPAKACLMASLGKRD